MNWEKHLVYQARHLATCIDIRKKVLKMTSKLNFSRQKSCSTWVLQSLNTKLYSVNISLICT